MTLTDEYANVMTLAKWPGRAAAVRPFLAAESGGSDAKNPALDGAMPCHRPSGPRAGRAAAGAWRTRAITVPSRNLEERGGTFEAIVGDTVLVNLLESEATGAAQATPMRIPLDSVTRLDVSHGRHRRTARGAGVGFLVGAAVGAIAGPVSMESEYGCDTSPAVAAAAGGLVFGGLGALIGLGFGAKSPCTKDFDLPSGIF